jgi:DNA-binding NtrC family response regulator
MGPKKHTTHDKAKFLFHVANLLLKENKNVLFIDHGKQISALKNHYLLNYPLSKKTILFASTEEDSLAAIQDDHFHLAIIVVDILNPEGIELQLIKEIKLRAKYKKIPVILVSENLENESAQKAISLGIQNIIVAPFSCNQFLEKVTSLLGNLPSKTL